MIVIGHCQNLNGLQFHITANGTFASSINCKLQPNSTSGAHFGYSYQPGTLFITWMNLHQYLRPNLHLIPMFLYIPILHHIWHRLLGYHPIIILIFIQLCLMMDLLQDIAIIFLKLLLLLVVQSYHHGFRRVKMLHYS
jgi:hypothetical protein